MIGQIGEKRSEADRGRGVKKSKQRKKLNKSKAEREIDRVTETKTEKSERHGRER